MDSLPHKVPERGIDHSLPFDTVLAREGWGFDAQAEMAFAGRVVTAVPPMLLAVVGEFDPAWAKAPN